MLLTLKVSTNMTDFIIKKLPYDLSSHAGLAFIGKYLKSIKINSLIDSVFPVRSGVANSDILKSYLGLLCLGKNDFDAIENFRTNAFFKRALGLRDVPSSPTLRQRLNAHASSWFDMVPQMNQKLLASRVNGKPIDFGALDCGYTPVDLDTFAMNNSFTKKELVGRTYAGVDGYCPFAVYLGRLGYCLELALRPGKRECIWQESLDLAKVGSDANPVRRVYRLTERTIDKHGVVLLLPEYVLEGWTTTLPPKFSPAEIIALYCDHATHEQFHSEFKTDMDLERLPSGKFDTNYLVCQLAAVAMNLLRLIGQNTLNDPDTPVRHTAQRRRIRTVMHEMMFKAARMIKHAGRWILGLGESDSGFAVFERHYGQLKTA